VEGGFNNDVPTGTLLYKDISTLSTEVLTAD